MHNLRSLDCWWFATIVALMLWDTVFAAESVDASPSYTAMLRWPDLVKGGTVQPHWLADGSFWFVKASVSPREYWRAHPDREKLEPLFDADGLRSALTAAKVPEATAEVIEVTPDAHEFILNVGGTLVEYSPAQHVATVISPEKVLLRHRRSPQALPPAYPSTDVPELFEVPAPNGAAFLTQIESNLAVRNAVDNRVTQLTTDGLPDDAWLISQARWSSSGHRILVQRLDQTQVNKIPLLHILGRDEQVRFVPYGRAGESLGRRCVFVIEVDSKELHEIRLPPSTQFVKLIGFSADESTVSLLTMDRLGKQVDILSAPAQGGEARVLFSERSDTFLFISGSFEGAPPPLRLPNGDWLWISSRDGWRNLYRLTADGLGLLHIQKQLTKGHLNIQKVVGLDAYGGAIYATAKVESPRPYDVLLYRISIRDGRLSRITPEDAEHEVSLSPDGRYVVDTYSTVEEPPRSVLRSNEGRVVLALDEADICGLRAAGWQPPEEFVEPAADGVTPLHGILFKPFNFDPSRHYPVVEYIYGGAFVAIVPHRFVPTILAEHLIFAQALAQEGFIVVALDARGTPERGKAFQDVVYGNVGRYEIEDHAAVLERLGRERPYMDLKRVGIFGNSYGGYFATRALLQRPDLYSVGVAGGAAQDLATVVADPIEPFMGGRPQDVPQAYDYANNLLLADRLQGSLLLIQGTEDVNVPLSQALKMTDALVNAGRPVDLLILPEQNHHYEYADSPRRNPYWNEAVRRYLVSHLHP